MKKKLIFFIIILIICVSILGIIIFNKSHNDLEQKYIEEAKNTNNISGQYSSVKVNDYETAKESLKDVQEVLKIKNIDSELVLDEIDTTGNYINTYKFSQLYNEIEVYNGGLIIYTDKSGNTKGIINNFKEINNIDTTQQSDSKDIETKIREEYSDKFDSIEDYKNVIYMLDDGSFTLAHLYNVKLNNEILGTETIILQDKTNTVLQKGNDIYELEKSDYDYFLTDNKYDLGDTKRNIYLLKQENGKLDEKNSLNTETYSWNKNEQISNENELYTKLICTTQKCYDYYKDKLGYISFNGTDSNQQIKLITNVKEYYGEDKHDTILSIPSSSAIIVGSDNNYNDNIECLGHEYTHCIFYNRTGSQGDASMENQALNEAYSDIMGMCMEANYNGNTTIDGYISANNSRDIKNSNAKYKDLTNFFKKNKYYYSMIISKTAYLMNQKISLDKVEHLWFESMKLLKQNAKFNDCYYAIIEIAKAMNFSNDEIQIIKDSFSEVGIKAEILDYMKAKAVDSWNERTNDTMEKTENNIDVVGDWKATKTSNDNYSLGYIYGTSVTTNNSLKLNADGTYTLYLGFIFSQKGNYQTNGTIINLINNEYTGDNPDYKMAQQLKINDDQIILEEKADDNTSVNIIFENVKNISNNTTSTETNNNNNKTNNGTTSTNKTNTNTSTNTNDNTSTTTQTPSKTTAKDFKVGSATVKYGTYKGIDAATGETLILKSDGTATLNGKSYKFTVEKYNFGQDSSSNSMEDGIIFKDSSGSIAFAVYVGNDGTLYNEPNGYVYSGN